MLGEYVFIAPPGSERRPPALSRRQAIVLATALLWLSGLVLSVVRGVIDGRDDFSEMATARTLIYIAGALMCWPIAVAITAIHRWKVWARLTVAAVAVVAIATAFNQFGYAAYGLVNPQISNKNLNLWLFNIIYWIWFYGAWTAIYFSIGYAYSVRDAERRSARLQVMASRSQIQALHFQLNPHFLFNTLNGISSLILDRKTDEADEMVAQLSDFMRETLTLDPLALIPLASEIKLQRDYLAIEQHRFRDLHVVVTVSDDLANALVPPLILQPLVENAVRHGAACSRQPTTIRITASERDDLLLLSVSDDAAPVREAKTGTGTGLRNVRERLRLYYGEKASLEAAPFDPGGFEVRLMLPREIRA